MNRVHQAKVSLLGDLLTDGHITRGVFDVAIEKIAREAEKNAAATARRKICDYATTWTTFAFEAE